MNFKPMPGLLTIFTLSAFFSILLLGSCKKESISTTQSQLSQENTDAAVVKTTENGNAKLILRPGPHKSQDVYVDKLDGLISSNQSAIPELPINEWTNGGTPLHTRSYIKFVDLSLVPSTANVISAKLYLYGMSSSLNSPQGNSWYPGSPYTPYGDNSCWVQQVVSSNWDEKTLTYDNQPTSTTEDEATLPASTSQWNYDAVVDVTAIVKKMVANPSSNFGFSIRLKEEQRYRSIVFASAEACDVTERPKLIVTYQ